ncbi:MAG: mechanosensitive ion channel family protein [Candidatus Zixiibacteriota bacterium]
MEEIQGKLIEWLSLYGMRVVGALLILLVGRIVTGLVVNVVGKLMHKANVDRTLSRFMSSLVRIVLMAFIVIAAINKLGVATTSFVAVLGAAGLAVGLALQGSLANFASGVMLILFRPFKAGDYIEAAGTAGSVEEIRIFNTVLTTLDNRSIIVPNASVLGGTITNYSAHDTRRIDLTIGIGYDDDLKEARTVLVDILATDDRILEDPSATVVVKELGDSSVNFAVRPWVKSADYWSVLCDLNERVKLAFDEKGISIPYPQHDVHMYQESAA